MEVSGQLIKAAKSLYLFTHSVFVCFGIYCLSFTHCIRSGAKGASSVWSRQNDKIRAKFQALKRARRLRKETKAEEAVAAAAATLEGAQGEAQAGKSKQGRKTLSWEDEAGDAWSSDSSGSSSSTFNSSSSTTSSDSSSSGTSP